MVADGPVTGVVLIGCGIEEAGVPVNAGDNGPRDMQVEIIAHGQFQPRSQLFFFQINPPPAFAPKILRALFQQFADVFLPPGFFLAPESRHGHPGVEQQNHFHLNADGA